LTRLRLLLSEKIPRRSLKRGSMQRHPHRSPQFLENQIFLAEIFSAEPGPEPLRCFRRELGSPPRWRKITPPPAETPPTEHRSTTVGNNVANVCVLFSFFFLFVCLQRIVLTRRPTVPRQELPEPPDPDSVDPTTVTKIRDKKPPLKSFEKPPGPNWQPGKRPGMALATRSY